jgi:hypothetical protein
VETLGSSPRTSELWKDCQTQSTSTQMISCALLTASSPVLSPVYALHHSWSFPPILLLVCSPGLRKSVQAIAVKATTQDRQRT